eukprot:CAMPEP_0115116370 /NCGR_PEP_ID=MMETSP0227-20121206/43243_1 /TAXON_ID=89957 /ORGANISM="Polarella glacialis, Strain CCMP 1383" /LENGTH=329 /DNA_ID=CAMNT_0002517211 /DNA_START=56 /DNA_END=1045 /DNA_ORIENTATION=+
MAGFPRLQLPTEATQWGSDQVLSQPPTPTLQPAATVWLQPAVLSARLKPHPVLQLPAQAVASPTGSGVCTPSNVASTYWRTTVCPDPPQKRSVLYPHSAESSPMSIDGVRTPVNRWPTPSPTPKALLQSPNMGYWPITPLARATTEDAAIPLMTLSAAYPEAFCLPPRKPALFRRTCSLPTAPEGKSMDYYLDEVNSTMAYASGFVIPSAPSPMEMHRTISSPAVSSWPANFEKNALSGVITSVDEDSDITLDEDSDEEHVTQSSQVHLARDHPQTPSPQKDAARQETPSTCASAADGAGVSPLRSVQIPEEKLARPLCFFSQMEVETP